MPAIASKTLSEFGTLSKDDAINITGGEPILNPHCKTILEIILETNAKITFSTNAYEKIENIELLNLLLCASRIQIPLDGVNQSSISEFRCDTHNYHEKVLNFVDVLRTMKFSGIIKFGTVLMGENTKKLNNIFELIKSFKIPNVEWCIYPFISSDGKYIYPDENKLISLKSHCNNNHISFKLFNPICRNDKYIFVNPDGTMTTIRNNVEIPIRIKEK